MKKVVKLTESDLEEIVRRVIKEQLSFPDTTYQQGKGKKKEVEPKKTEDKVKSYIGKTVNIYDKKKSDDVNEKRVPFKKLATIKDLKLNDDLTLDLKLGGTMTADLKFDCEEPNYLKVDKFIRKDKIFYNENLTESFKKDFCDTKADFASNNNMSGRNFA